MVNTGNIKSIAARQVTSTEYHVPSSSKQNPEVVQQFSIQYQDPNEMDNTRIQIIQTEPCPADKPQIITIYPWGEN